MVFTVLVICLIATSFCTVWSNGDTEILIRRYIEYLSKFGKNEERVFDPKRLIRFSSTLRFLENHQKLHYTTTHFKVGLNEMSDWLDDELKERFPAIIPARLGVGMKPDVDGNFSNSANSVNNTGTNGDHSNSLNWATSDNRLGVSVLPPIRNQGSCGACWAFVAVSAIEASVHLNSKYQNQSPLPLSAQELIDCDTVSNRGCLGGNPLYAFEYAMLAGVTSWADYGYREKAGSCQRKKYRARASIAGFIRIAPNDQNLLMRHVAVSPVAVGVCGTDQTFIYYESGIFDASDCCVTQNHALLIVGYGRDNQLGLDYWVAQNSWGTSWGERGFIRLLRTADNSTGQCGLASSPCAAVGGYMINPNENGEQESVFNTEYFNHLEDKNFRAAFELWLEVHFHDLMLLASLCLLVASLSLLWCDNRDQLLETIFSGRAAAASLEGYQGSVSIP